MSVSLIHNEDAPLQALDELSGRKILAYNKDIMMVEVHFKTNGRGAVHTHPHVQCTYVRSGLFEFTVDDKPVIVGPGDSLCFEPNQPHGTLCLEAGILVDVFTPMREDFLK